ncbi:MAG: hypothetical protein HOW97_06895 [Catenulispora sp.]|nr:hypothetical protein [Catenulispora sp.]
MGEYTGRRRGRPASEPQPEPEYVETPSYDEGYFADESYGYGYEQGYQPGYEQPGYEQPSYEQPSYEQQVYEQPSYEQQVYEQPGYEQPSYEQQAYEQASYEQPNYDYGYESPSYETYGYEGYETAQYVEPEPQQRPHSRRGNPSAEEMYAPEYGYQEQYSEQYSEQYVEQYAESYDGEYYEEYTEQYAEDYAEPRFESRRRSAGPAQEYEPEYAPGYAPDYDSEYAPGYDYAPPRSPRTREALPLLSHLPFLGASTAALVIASFVSAKAVAAVVLPLQLLVAWAILDLAGHASRRTAALVALPTLAATVGTFKFQADESATALAGGLGAGFFLLAADAVFRAGRRGVAPGTVQAVAAAASALLFAGLTGLFLPAARLDQASVALGAAAGALAGLAAARNPELGSSRVVVVALPATVAALASYAAAILMA